MAAISACFGFQAIALHKNSFHFNGRHLRSPFGGLACCVFIQSILIIFKTERCPMPSDPALPYKNQKLVCWPVFSLKLFCFIAKFDLSCTFLHDRGYNFISESTAYRANVSVKFKLWQPLLRYIDFVSITLTVCYSLKNNLEADIQCTLRTLYHCE